MTKPDYWEKIIKESNGKTMIIGEIHGVSANPDILHLFVKKIRPKTVFVELPIYWNSDNGFLDIDKLKELAGGSEPEAAGIIGLKHINIFKLLFASGIMTKAIRKNFDDWNDTDNFMAEQIKQSSQNSETNIAIIGNLHAQKNFFEEDGYLYKPTASNLKNVITVLIKYGNAKARNFDEIINLKDDEVIKNLGGEEYLLKPSASKDFDYEFLVRESEILGKI